MLESDETRAMFWEPHATKACRRYRDFVYLFLDGKGGEVGMPWNEGACGRQTDSNGIYTKTYSSCRFTQSLQATPQIFQVQPRAGHTLPGETSVDNKGAKTSVAPGDEIVVSGRLCFGDTVDNTLKDSEGNLLMPGDEYQEVLNEVISRDYVPSSTNNDKELRQAALGMMSRVSLGPDFSCELRTRSDEDDEEGLLYPAPNEAVKWGKLQDSPSRGGYQSFNRGAHHYCTDSAFVCRIPDDIPSGKYPLNFLYGRGVEGAPAAHGHSIYTRREVHGGGGWGGPFKGSTKVDRSPMVKSQALMFDPSTGGDYVLEVGPRIEAVSMRASSCPSAEDCTADTLLIEGKGLGGLSSVTVAETLTGGVACATSAAATNGTWLECKVDGDLEQLAQLTVDLSAAAWKKASNESFSQTFDGDNSDRIYHDFNSFNATGEPFMGQGGVERERWAFEGGKDYLNFGGGVRDFWEPYNGLDGALKDVVGMVYAMRHSGRPPTDNLVMGHHFNHPSAYDGLSEEFGKTAINYYSAVFVAPETGLWRYKLRYAYSTAGLVGEYHGRHDQKYGKRVVMKLGGEMQKTHNWWHKWRETGEWRSLKQGDKESMEIFTAHSMYCKPPAHPGRTPNDPSCVNNEADGTMEVVLQVAQPIKEAAQIQAKTDDSLTTVSTKHVVEGTIEKPATWEIPMKGEEGEDGEITGGTYTLTLSGGATTAPIAWDAEPNEIEDAIAPLFDWSQCTSNDLSAHRVLWREGSMQKAKRGWKSDIFLGKGVTLDRRHGHCGKESLFLEGSKMEPNRGASFARSPKWSQLGTTSGNARYLTFAYKIPAGNKAHLLLRFDANDVTARCGPTRDSCLGTCSVKLNWDLAPEEQWYYPPCGDGNHGVNITADGEWHVAELDLFSIMSEVDAELVEVRFDTPFMGLYMSKFAGAPWGSWFEQPYCPLEAEDRADALSWRRLTDDFWIDDVLVGPTPAGIARVPGTELPGLVEGKGAVDSVKVSMDRSKYAWATLKVKQTKIKVEYSGGCAEDAGSSTDGADRFVLEGDFSGLEGSAGALAALDFPDAPRIPALDEGVQGLSEVTATLWGVSFPGGPVSVKLNFADTPAQWKAAIDSMHPKLDVSVSDVRGYDSDTGYPCVQCFARKREIDWKAPLFLSDATIGDRVSFTASDPDAGMDVSGWSAGSRQGYYTRLHTPFDVSRMYFRKSSTPGVIIRDGAGRPADCAVIDSTCSGIVQLPDLVDDFTSWKANVTSVSRRRALLASGVSEDDILDAIDDEEEDPHAVVKRREAKHGPRHEVRQSSALKVGWEAAPPRAPVMSSDEMEALRSKVIGTGQITTYREARAKAREHGSRRRQLMSMAAGDNLEHRFSDTATWGGLAPPSDEDTDIVYIPANTTLLLDESVHIRFWVVEGVLKVPEDVGKDIKLESEAIIINGEYGKFLVGSEAAAHPHKFELLLHGTRGTQTLPVFGIKTLAMTDGELFLRGKEVSPTWSLLETTAEVGDSTIQVQGATNWQVGDEIVIAGTGLASERSCTLKRTDDKCQSEERKITALSETEGVTTVTLDKALEYEHVGETHSAGGETMETRAEVLHLTRSILIHGTTDDPSFGSHVMALRGKVNLKYVETTFAGQAYSLGRYAFHIHTVGQPDALGGTDQSHSSVEGCAIHKSFNRALTAHACHNLNVKRNVAYNVMGHQYFIEDGIESGNTYTENVGLIAHRAFSLLNADQTPACFWITNPNNNFIGNHAVGGHSHGFWWDTPMHPMGPSATTAVHCRNQPVGTFDRNMAHSNGDSGYWFTEVDPTESGGPAGLDNPRRAYVMTNSVAWANPVGVAFQGGTGHLKLEGWKFGSNMADALTWINIKADRHWTPENTDAHVIDSPIFFGDSKPAFRWKKRNRKGNRMRKVYNGNILSGPGGGYVTVKDAKFINYRSAPIKSCGAQCGKGAGGFEVRFRGTQMIGSTSDRGHLSWGRAINDNVIFDMDGTITGEGKPVHIASPDGRWTRDENGTVIFASWDRGGFKNGVTVFTEGVTVNTDERLGHFPQDSCQYEEGVHGIVCDASKVTLRQWHIRRKNGPLTTDDIRIETPYGFSFNKFYMYDAEGTRFNNHAVVAFRKKTMKPIEHLISAADLAPGRFGKIMGWKNPQFTGFNVELSELRQDEWAVISTNSTSLPHSYRTRGPLWDRNVNNYKRLSANDAEFDADWAGWRWDDHSAGHYIYEPNMANPKNIGWKGKFQTLLSAQTGPGSVGGFFGPHICQQKNGSNTTECRIHPRVNDADIGCPFDDCYVHMRDFRTKNQCMDGCRRANGATVCNGFVWHNRQKWCFFLRGLDAWPGPYDLNPHYEGYTGAEMYHRLPPAGNAVNGDGEVFDGAGIDGKMPICEMGLSACNVYGRTGYAYGKADCPPGEVCNDLSITCIDDKKFEDAEWNPPRRWPVGAAFDWCDESPKDELGNNVNWTVPTDGDNVVIQEGWTVTLGNSRKGAACMNTAKLAHMDIYGSLLIKQSSEVTITAETILIGPNKGMLSAGTAEEPFNGHFVIQHYGSWQTSFAKQHPYGPANRKFLLVLGSLHLHGKTKATWARMSADAAASATEIDVKIENADPSQWLNSRIVIAPSFEDYTEDEVVTVTAMRAIGDDGVYRMTVDPPLTYDHRGPMDGDAQGVPGTEVGWLGPEEKPMNIEFRGMDDPPGSVDSGDDPQMLGAAMMVAEANMIQDCRGFRFQGQALIDGVKFSRCGQRSSGAGCLEMAGAFNAPEVLNANGKPVADGPFVGGKQYARNNVFETGYGYGIKITRKGRGFGPDGALVHDNVLYKMTVISGIWSGGHLSKTYRNLLIHIRDVRSDYMKMIGSVGIKWTLYRGRVEDQLYFRDNAVAGGQFRGILQPTYPCEWYGNPEYDSVIENTFGNVVHSSRIGFTGGGSYRPREELFPGTRKVHGFSTRYPPSIYGEKRINTRCKVISHQISYSNSAYGVVAAVADGTVWLTDMLLVENKLGFSAWHRNGASKGLNPGARDMHSRVMNSVIVGSTRGICGHTGLAPSTFYGGTEPFRPNQMETHRPSWAGPSGKTSSSAVSGTARRGMAGGRVGTTPSRRPRLPRLRIACSGTTTCLRWKREA